MLKTVKVKKQMRLDELIKYIFDNGIEDKVFPSNGGSSFDMCEARISGSGNIKMSGYINEHTTFTVEVEEEITEETEFLGVQEVFKYIPEQALETEMHPQTELKSIKDVLDEHDAETECLQIYAKVNGKLELIWEAK